MPTLLKDEVIDGYAWCNAPGGACAGYAQKRVPLRLVEYGRTFAEGGATEPWAAQVFENTTPYLSFVEDEDANCTVCGHAMEKSSEARPSYDGAAQNDQQVAMAVAEDNRLTVMEEQMKAQAELIHKLLAEKDAG